MCASSCEVHLNFAMQRGQRWCGISKSSRRWPEPCMQHRRHTQWPRPYMCAISCTAVLHALPKSIASRCCAVNFDGLAVTLSCSTWYRKKLNTPVRVLMLASPIVKTSSSPSYRSCIVTASRQYTPSPPSLMLFDRSRALLPRVRCRRPSACRMLGALNCP